MDIPKGLPKKFFHSAQIKKTIPWLLFNATKKWIRRINTKANYNNLHKFNHFNDFKWSQKYKKNLHLIIRKIVSNDIANDYVNGLNSNKFVRYNIKDK